MLITEVTADMLPLWQIETLRDNTFWAAWTIEPFRTRTEALAHLDLLRAEYPDFPHEQSRVAQYTTEHWRADLIKATMKDDDAVRRALSILRTETLADLLK